VIKYSSGSILGTSAFNKGGYVMSIHRDLAKRVPELVKVLELSS
jgi:hypothetical protein